MAGRNPALTCRCVWGVHAHHLVNCSVWTRHELFFHSEVSHQGAPAKKQLLLKDANPAPAKERLCRNALFKKQTRETALNGSFFYCSVQTPPPRAQRCHAGKRTCRNGRRAQAPRRRAIRPCFPQPRCNARTFDDHLGDFTCQWLSALPAATSDGLLPVCGSLEQALPGRY
jgi:hypothetical protein